MANLTKTQIKKQAKELREKWDKLQSQFLEVQEGLNDLADQVREEADSVEPYEGKYDLTQQQEERLEWLEEQADNLEALRDDQADQIESLLNEVLDALEEIKDN